ncbi:MAG: CocE/NonD family hydrolase [Victivallales bacterium]|nr:CocE/NonD family hydrolase [Victivallales bacterium]
MPDIKNPLPPPRELDIESTMKNIMLPMRDGVKLFTSIIFPAEMPEKAPVVLLRSSYMRRTYLELPEPECLANGFIFIRQSTRGTGWSQGTFDPAERDLERNDAEDFFKWLDEQPWYNGRCVMIGSSYLAWTQWSAMRIGYHGLVGITPRVGPLSGCIGSAVPGGGASQSFTTHWMLSMHHRTHFGYESVPNYDEMEIDWKLPICDADIIAGYGVNEPFRKFLDVARTPAKSLLTYQADFSGFRCPAFIQGGWFDGFKCQTIESFQLMRKNAATPEARNFTRLLIGPWVHGGLANPDIFGAETNYDELTRRLWKFVRGILADPTADPMPEIPPVTYYMIGENCWCTAETWPPQGSRPQTFYLHSNGNANSNRGDGRIDSAQPQAAEQSDTYISDPNHPVLSNNGRHEALGCYDLTPQEERADVLVYTSDIMTTPLTIAGEVKLNFHASVSTPDTDFCATLTDVTPDGRSMLLTSGTIRARFRNSLEHEELMIPNDIYEFTIDLSHIAARIKPGHRLRLSICGQSFPTLHRNANSGKRLFTDTELFPARCTILHDADHPARLVLDTL